MESLRTRQVLFLKRIIGLKRGYPISDGPFFVSGNRSGNIVINRGKRAKSNRILIYWGGLLFYSQGRWLISRLSNRLLESIRLNSRMVRVSVRVHTRSIGQ